ncbi:uncharacterized protein LOC122499334 [Leptopilina heterotoma]|uniref:uncharacterized protein LOC122499334 n=1 Tax=Leptopilina heterotoma TaxID=63436 RepID=UPI001CA94CD3|nr:uncharacterized protein LOC122499334 [Leptopilina heterotoma]
MLYPLVESSLPEEVLRAWQRTSAASGAKDSKSRLTQLMEFLGSEVENEERIRMAIAGFSLGGTEKSKRHRNKDDSPHDVPTAMELLTTQKIIECMFCKNNNHNSKDCYKAKKMSLSERREIAKEANSCFNCLKQGHSYRRCKSKIKCAWCNRRHVLLMCPGQGKSVNSGDNGDSKNEVRQEQNLASFTGVPEVYLQTLCVKLVNGNRECTIRVLFDSGSQCSYLTREAIDKLNYSPIKKQELIHTLFGGVKSTPEKHGVYLIHLKSLSGEYACNFQAMDKEVICGDVAFVKSAEWKKELENNGVFLSDVGEGKKSIDLLIGADVMGKLLTGRKYDVENGLMALETRLGWTVMGKCNTEISRCDTVLFNNDLQVDEASVSNLWQLDVLGIQDPLRRKTRQKRVAEVEQNFRETFTVNNKSRYEVSLPWIQEHAPLGSNIALCIKRLENTMMDLEKRGLVDEYGEIFREWEREGIIEKVPDSELNNPSHYLPHRPIVRPNSISTRIRSVFDAASRERNSPSINQCLDKGPNLIELIPTVILGFRKEEVGVTADVKAAFLQISVAPSDRDYLRFLWRSGDKMITYRYKRDVFGLTCSPSLLVATIKFHLEKVIKNDINVNISDKILMKMNDCFYSDNCVTSVESPEDFVQFKSEVTRILEMAGFDLRRWECTGDNNNSGETSVLGLVWNKVEDTLSVNLASIPSNLECHTITKRFILSVAQRVFDPIGFRCPVMLYPKLLLQKIWKENVEWDSVLEGKIKSEFQAWIKSLNHLKDLKIPRKLSAVRENSETSFQVFADASGHAYAAVVFIRTEYAEKTEVQLIGAKSRVVPTKEITIPRLELLAATIAARLAKSLINALNFENPEIIYWSDSSAVITWINQEAQWSTFVYNRVQEIRQLTAGAKWRHVPGTQNPADLPSRGCKASQLLASRW